MKWLYLFILFLLFAVLLTFVIQNTDVATVRFLNWSIELPRSLLMVIVYVLGMLSGWSVVAFFRRSWAQIRKTPDERVHKG